MIHDDQDQETLVTTLAEEQRYKIPGTKIVIQSPSSDRMADIEGKPVLKSREHTACSTLQNLPPPKTCE